MPTLLSPSSTFLLASLALPCAACGTSDSPPAAGPTGSDAGLGAPTYETQFTSADGWPSRSQPKGSVGFGIDDPGAEDQKIVTLLFPRDPTLGSADGAGPANASEIDPAQKFSFGTYRTRVKLAHCSPAEELVNGVFTY